jgi:hypothetical protein
MHTTGDYLDAEHPLKPLEKKIDEVPEKSPQQQFKVT